MLGKTVLFATMLAIVPAIADARPLRDGQDRSQEAARERKQRGAAIGSVELERRAKAANPDAEYIGFEYDPTTNIYTLRFLRNGKVSLVKMDGRTGRIIARIGN